MSEPIEDRVQERIPEAKESIRDELIQTATDRLCIRLGEDTLPTLFESICVDAVVKMYRRVYYEGISSEGAANISTTFVDDVLAEYAQEVSEWKSRKANSVGSGRTVRFL